MAGEIAIVQPLFEISAYIVVALCTSKSSKTAGSECGIKRALLWNAYYLLGA